jgi:hypothetical protein
MDAVWNAPVAQRRKERLRRGALERTGCTDQTHDRENARYSQPMAPRSQGKDRGRQALHSQRNAVNHPAVVAVGDVPCDKSKDDNGHELHEACHSQHERAVRDFVDLPADGHRTDLESHTGSYAGAPKPAICGIF